MNLNQVTLPSSDIDRSIDFYKRLGLILIVHGGDHYARFECPEGHSTFSVHLQEPGSIQHGGVVYFEVEELDDYVSTLQESGISFDSLPEDKPWLWREAHLRDPDGNPIILFKAGENRKNPPWRIQNSN